MLPLRQLLLFCGVPLNEFLSLLRVTLFERRLLLPSLRLRGLLLRELLVIGLLLPLDALPLCILLRTHLLLLLQMLAFQHGRRGARRGGTRRGRRLLDVSRRRGWSARARGFHRALRPR